ncbi:hypothetical protein D3C87_1937240 [compost metagenome]
MASLGVPRLTVSRVLNHTEGGITSIYDRYSYDGEKRQALETWGKELVRILDAKKDLDKAPLVGIASDTTSAPA